MANLKVFISSTCYDLSVVRSQLRNFLVGVGYEPVMSEYADVLFDPRLHTHTSCIQEVMNCDIILLIIGSRYGGTAIPQAIELVDIEKVKELSTAQAFAEYKDKLSVTQLEVLKAVQSGIPIFTFIDTGVMHDHLTYEKNKHKKILADIEFPHIDKQETAIYVFEFINFLRHRVENNSIIEFAKLDDIEIHLKKQWAALFQRLLNEQKTKAMEEVRIDYLTNQIADLKTAIMTSISSSELKETAKGAIKFRMLIDFIYSLGIRHGSANIQEILRSDMTWDEILTELGIKEILADNTGSINPRSVLIRTDNTYYKSNFSPGALSRLTTRWDEFRQASPGARDAIINAVLDNSETRPMSMMRHFDAPYIEVSPMEKAETGEEEVHIL